MSVSYRSDLAVLLVALCVMAGVSASYISQDKTLSRSKMFLIYEKILRLEPKVEDVQYTLTQFDSRFGELLARMDALIMKIDSQQMQLDNQKTQLDSQKTQLDSQQAQLDSQKTQLDSQQTQLDSQKTQLDSQQTQLDSQQTQLDSQQTQLDNQKIQLGSLQSQVTGRMDRLEQVATTARDCSELPAGATTGIHLLRPGLDHSQSIVEAYCDMDTAGGRWTVFQRRDDIQPRQDFYLGWSDYKHGFGNLTGEFWWGLDYLWQLTSVRGRPFELRIDLQDFDGNTAHAVYKNFSISSEEDGYRLSASNYTGDAGDSLSNNVDSPFSTWDRDGDNWTESCAEERQGAWWYGYCTNSNLNGRHLVRRGENVWTGIVWWHWKSENEPLKKTEMKIRPT